MSYLGTKDWQMEARFGNVTGVSAFTQLGHTDSLSDTLRYLHHSHTTADLDIIALYDTPATVKVASTAAADVLTSGTGAWTVQLTGYDGSNNLITESVNLSGTTESAATTATFKMVRDVTVTAVGSGGSNAGVIWVGNGTFTSGVPTTKYMSVEIGTNISRGGSMLVEAGKAFWPQQLVISTSDTTKLLNVQYSSYNGSIAYEVFDIHLKGDSQVIIPVQSFGSFAAGTLVGVKVGVDTAGGIATTALAGVLRDV